jgi:hypothetical protein
LNDKGEQDRKFAWHILLVERHAVVRRMAGPDRAQPEGLRNLDMGALPERARPGIGSGKLLEILVF